MNENQFIIDLGQVALTAEQRGKINAALQAAVAKELLNVPSAGNAIAFPFHGIDKPDFEEIFGKTPIFRNGIIVRDFDKQNLKDFAKLKTKRS